MNCTKFVLRHIFYQGKLGRGMVISLFFVISASIYVTNIPRALLLEIWVRCTFVYVGMPRSVTQGFTKLRKSSKFRE